MEWFFNLFKRRQVGVKLFNHTARLDAARCMFCDKVFTRSLVRPVVVTSAPGQTETEVVFACKSCALNMGSSDPTKDIYDSED